MGSHSCLGTFNFSEENIIMFFPIILYIYQCPFLWTLKTLLLNIRGEDDG